MALAVALFAVPTGAAAQDAAQDFRQNCASCHTIGGGRLTGPDLQNVTDRQERAWLVRFIVDPKAFIDRGDPYALKLLRSSRGVIMPTLAGMSRQRAEALLDLIEVESGLERSRFAGLQVPDLPFTEIDVQNGQALFTGRRALANGGPACIACHTVPDLPWLGGGRLGPDLTRAYERLEGRKGLTAWLSSPATPTMQPLFAGRQMTQEEVLAIVALLEQSARTGAEADAVPLLNFILLGLCGAIGALIGFDLIWRRRFRGVRRAMVFGEGLRRQS